MDPLYPSPAAVEFGTYEQPVEVAIEGRLPLLKSACADAAGLAILEQIQGWTRRRFGLEAAAAVLVAEVRCRVAFCPPLETAVAFWTVDGSRHQFRLYKPMSEVVYDDIGWLMVSLSAHDGMAWDCC